MWIPKQLFEISKDYIKSGFFETLVNKEITWDEWCELYRIAIPQKNGSYDGIWMKFVNDRNQTRLALNDLFLSYHRPYSWEIAEDGKTVILRYGDGIIKHRGPRRQHRLTRQMDKDRKEFIKMSEITGISTASEKYIETSTAIEKLMMDIAKGKWDEVKEDMNLLSEKEKEQIAAAFGTDA
jgi:hypothetical protein